MPFEGIDDDEKFLRGIGATSRDAPEHAECKRWWTLWRRELDKREMAERMLMSEADSFRINIERAEDIAKKWRTLAWYWAVVAVTIALVACVALAMRGVR